MLGERFIVFDHRGSVKELSQQSTVSDIAGSKLPPREIGSARTDLEDVFLADELFPLPTRKQAELGTDQADLARPAPNYGRRARERDELVELDERALERALDKSLSLVGESAHASGEGEKGGPEETRAASAPRLPLSAASATRSDLAGTWRARE